MFAKAVKEPKGGEWQKGGGRRMADELELYGGRKSRVATLHGSRGLSAHGFVAGETCVA